MILYLSREAALWREIRSENTWLHILTITREAMNKATTVGIDLAKRGVRAPTLYGKASASDPVRSLPRVSAFRPRTGRLTAANG